MFFLSRPSRPTIEHFIDASRELPLSYEPVGLVSDDAASGDIDEAAVAIGQGAGDFKRARTALGAWAPFDLDWVELFPRRASQEPGTIVAVLIRHLGFWSLNGCRVVYTLGDRHHGDRVGFAYGTLTNHAEAGEELFEVSRDPGSDVVTYRIRAVSRPRATPARIGYPIVRHLQARFRRDSAAAMRRATRA